MFNTHTCTHTHAHTHTHHHMHTLTPTCAHIYTCSHTHTHTHHTARTTLVHQSLSRRIAVARADDVPLLLLLVAQANCGKPSEACLHAETGSVSRSTPPSPLSPLSPSLCFLWRFSSSSFFCLGVSQIVNGQVGVCMDSAVPFGHCAAAHELLWRHEAERAVFA